MSTTFETLIYEVDVQGICTITINRPDKLNALNNQVFLDLDDLISVVESDNSIKLVIITGAGNKAFVAGADIKEFSDFDSKQASELSAKGHRVFKKIENLAKPVIAAINGFALGGGCELAMACHLRVASSSAKLGLPEVTLGLIPGYGGTQRLVALVGKAKAFELIFTGSFIDAHEALKYGLVNQVGESALEEAKKIANSIIKKAPIALKNVILAVNAFESTHDGYNMEAKLFGELFETEDFKKGIDAFFRKKNPSFSGK
jgi:enoyl-CoA hydratase